MRRSRPRPIRSSSSPLSLARSSRRLSREELAGKLKDCRFVKLGDGIHFLQEDHPETIGRSVAAFIAEVESRRGKKRQLSG